MISQTSIITKSLDQFITKIVKKITLGTTEHLVKDTPRLTGFAESNWIPKIGAPNNTPVGAKDGVSRNEQKIGLATVASSYMLPAEVYISNPVSYINLLNEGSSRKAPRGFVQIAIAKGIRTAL